jgi:hypothetical protein
MGGSERTSRLTASLPLTGLRAQSGAAEAGQVLWVLAISRALVWMAALYALVLFGVNHALADGMDVPALTQPFGQTVNDLLAPAARYDAVWYLGIAQHGYVTQYTTAFFPLLPLLLRAGGWVLGSPLVFGVLLSLGAALASLVLLHRLTALTLGERAARNAVVLQAFFPTALFLSAVYTESLFLALSLASVLCARRERWMWAGLAGGLAAATRSTGVLLLVPLALMLLYGPRERAMAGGSPGGRWPGGGRAALRLRYRPGPEALWLLLVPVGLAAYLVYLQLAHRWGLAPLQAQAHWGRSFAGPFGAVWKAVIGLPSAVRRVTHGTQWPLVLGTPFGWQLYQLIDLLYLGLALGGLWACWRRLPFAFFAYALVSVAEGLSYPTPMEPMESLSRFLLVIFPLFMAWGGALAERPRLRVATLSLSTLALVGLSALWGIWGWVA